MSKRYAMTVDTRRCVGCNACNLACQAENDLPAENARNWIQIRTRGKFPHLSQTIQSQRCNHCENAPCVTSCPTGASYKAEGGTVLVDPDACTGCKACMASCPYDARTIHSDGYADKCTFCLHRVREGKTTACASVCPTGAITFGDRNDPSSAVSRLLKTRAHEVRKPELGLEPNVFYLK